MIFEHVESGRVTAITLDVPIVRCAEFDEPIAMLSLPVDMLVCANGSSCLGEAGFFVREGATVAPHALAQLIENCIFVYDEDCDNDSWDTQHLHFERDTRHIANSILLGTDEALLEQIRSIFLDEIQWLIPKDRQIALAASASSLSLSFADGA